MLLMAAISKWPADPGAGARACGLAPGVAHGGAASREPDQGKQPRSSGGSGAIAWAMAVTEQRRERGKVATELRGPWRHRAGDGVDGNRVLIPDFSFAQWPQRQCSSRRTCACLASSRRTCACVSAGGALASAKCSARLSHCRPVLGGCRQPSCVAEGVATAGLGGNFARGP